jgi:septin family protein
MRRSPVQLHKAWRAVWGVGRWVAKCKRSAGGKALTWVQEEVLTSAKERGDIRTINFGGDGDHTAEKLHAKIKGEQANSINVPSLEQTAVWLRQKADEAARRDDTKPGYMIILKAVGASDGEDEDGAWAGRMRVMKNEIQKQGGEQSRQMVQQNVHIAKLEQQNTELKQQMEQQNKDMKQQMEAMQQQIEQQDQKLADILAAVIARR